ncbi:carboxypeptidase-like regulatory domain-containing protein [Candidatus Halobeggiatoa sp. HSG11]|nr:carboxypeptidase-like regulatory domain-containing protein [Candidatus Halobeggiatoa sp. HSG11]
MKKFAIFGSLLLLTATVSAYDVVEVKDGGTITGKITFSGKDTPPKKYTVTKDIEVCGSGEREIDYVEVNDGVLANVVVYVDKVKKGKAFPEDIGDLTVDQMGCEFKPFFGVMMNEKELSAKNSDTVAHNIHTYELIGKAKKTVTNVSQPDKDSVVTKKIKLKRGTAMKIECDQHDFMHSFVFVAKNPYFAVVGADGNFEITDIPAGKYTVKAWHGVLKNPKTKTEVTAGGTTEVNFEFK